jgi:hypothetical protein
MLLAVRVETWLQFLLGLPHVEEERKLQGYKHSPASFAKSRLGNYQ